MLNSRLGLFTAAPSGCYTLTGHPFSRSYGVILPSSLTRVLPSALEFSSRLPVSVCGTGTWFLPRGFSWQCGIRDFATVIFARHHSSAFMKSGFAYSSAYLLGQTLPSVCSTLPSCVPPSINDSRWYRNFNLLSIVYAFRPRLRSRLTLSGRTFLRNP